jgi:hypothetical protein
MDRHRGYTYQEELGIIRNIDILEGLSLKTNIIEI